MGFLQEFLMRFLQEIFVGVIHFPVRMNPEVPFGISCIPLGVSFWIPFGTLPGISSQILRECLEKFFQVLFAETPFAIFLGIPTGILQQFWDSSGTTSGIYPETPSIPAEVPSEDFPGIPSGIPP